MSKDSKFVPNSMVARFLSALLQAEAIQSGPCSDPDCETCNARFAKEEADAAPDKSALAATKAFVETTAFQSECNCPICRSTKARKAQEPKGAAETGKLPLTAGEFLELYADNGANSFDRMQTYLIALNKAAEKGGYRNVFEFIEYNAKPKGGAEGLKPKQPNISFLVPGMLYNKKYIQDFRDKVLQAAVKSGEGVAPIEVANIFIQVFGINIEGKLKTEDYWSAITIAINILYFGKAAPVIFHKDDYIDLDFFLEEAEFSTSEKEDLMDAWGVELKPATK